VTEQWEAGVAGDVLSNGALPLLRAAPPVLLSAALLAGCAAPPGPPTLKDLETRRVVVAPDPGVNVRGADAAAAYRDALAAASAAQRRESQRRLADLEMERIDNLVSGAEANANANANTPAPPPADYRTAIARYEQYLAAYPRHPANDQVLYQLARANELGGRLEGALATLDRLLQEFPRTRYREEAQFRRGELLFTLRDYDKAEGAFATTLRDGSASPYYERALYMHGWSLFKLARVDEALQSFFGVLDGKLGGKAHEGELDALPGLTRADRELVEDTFRVTSLSLENLKGAASIPEYTAPPQRRDYEFRVYQHLADMYLKQERVKDAADALAAFAARQPGHPQAPIFQARVIDIYESNGFATLALAAKKDFVTQYAAGSELRRTRAEAWTRAQPQMRSHLVDLARHHHALAQKSRKTEDYLEAATWYRAVLEVAPADAQAAQNRFLLAELLFESGRYPEATVEYEKVAYEYPRHERSADAGYSALLGYARQEKAAGADAQKIQSAGIDSAIRFAREFASDTRSGPALTNAAEKLFALRDTERAARIAQQVVLMQPPVAAAQRRVAWTVIAHAAFEQGAFERAELAYGEVLALVPDKDPARGEFAERLAASIYKQGEAARSAGAANDAVKHFTRVGAAAPASAVRATAQYDAAAVQLAAKDWDGAVKTLEDFRLRFPKHPLQADVSAKLALAYSERGSWAQAAGEFERIAGGETDPARVREGLWRAAELYEKAKQRPAATRLYERYLKQFPAPLEPALEARSRLAGIARDEGNAARELALWREVQKSELAGGAARTDRTRYLGATAALALAKPLADDYRKVALVEPLKQTLRTKKTRMETALKAYAAATDYGVAEVTTAATWHTAELYRDFGKAMLTSQRPKGLKKDELEQYDVLLEEQAFPFEEKAIELHELNAGRAASGIYDRWVRASFESLAQLRPARYARSERSEGTIDALR
jgi:TolA-binding protein